MYSSEKVIALCADDYGLYPSINQAICTLAESHRITAISCMTNTPFWSTGGAMRLRSLKNISIGLHFDIQDRDLVNLMACSHLNMISRNHVQHHFEKQLLLFEEVMDRQPDFVDGHQHIHQFPHICDAILECYQKIFSGKKVWIRNTANALPGIKAKVLNMLGKKWKKVLHRDHIPTNQVFSGIYSFHNTAYDQVFAGFLKDITEPTLIMCHPGTKLQGNESFREREYAFFSGQKFKDMLAHENITLACTANKYVS